MLTSSRCLLGTMKMFRFCTACLLLPGGQGQALGAKGQRYRVAHFCSSHKALVTALLLCTPQPTIGCLSANHWLSVSNVVVSICVCWSCWLCCQKMTWPIVLPKGLQPATEGHLLPVQTVLASPKIGKEV